jgi:hypothetical protein
MYHFLVIIATLLYSYTSNHFWTKVEQTRSVAEDDYNQVLINNYISTFKRSCVDQYDDVSSWLKECKIGNLTDNYQTLINNRQRYVRLQVVNQFCSMEDYEMEMCRNTGMWSKKCAWTWLIDDLTSITSVVNYIYITICAMTLVYFIYSEFFYKPELIKQQPKPTGLYDHPKPTRVAKPLSLETPRNSNAWVSRDIALIEK